MAGSEYQEQLMLREYDTLRAEILQVFDQQMQLIFVTAISTATIFYGYLTKLVSGLPALPFLLAIMIGLCLKSIANYNRIFRIGSYLAVVHEQQGISEKLFKPSLDKAAWHTRWRRVARSTMIPWKGGRGGRAEAGFLGVIAASGWLLVFGNLETIQFVNPWHIVLLCTSGILTLTLGFLVVKLAMIVEVSKQYENAFRCEIKNESTES